MNLLKDGIENQSVQKTTNITKMTVDGITSDYPIYRIKLDNLFYNEHNDRIATWISQYKAENGEDSLNREDLDKYNAVIQAFIEKSNPEKMKETQEHISLFGQQRFGVVLNDGRVIDGNRRFSCLRNLSKENESFGYFEAIILEKNYEHSAKQIKMLELQIQIGAEERVAYDPVDRLVGIYKYLEDEKLLSIDEYARSTNMKRKEVENELEIAKLIVEFLEAIKAPKQYYLARELQLDGPMRELYGALKSVADEDKMQELKYIAFTNLLYKPAGDMSRFIRGLKGIAKSNYLDEFIEKEAESVEILDELPEVGKVNADVIAKVRSDEAKKEELRRNMAIIDNKVKVTDTRNRPNQMVKNAIDSLQSIDKVILGKLTEEQIEDMKSNVELLESIVAEIKEVLNV